MVFLDVTISVTLMCVVASIKVIPNAKPVFCPARPVPIAFHDDVTKELRRLEQMGVIERCGSEGVSNASPVVWVKKKDGGLRMCADYKVHVNQKILTDSYPLPRIEEVFNGLDKAKYFAKIDLKAAYWQIQLDEEAQELSVINTSLGLFKVTRLQMGMKNSASVFQRTMESVLTGLSGFICYQDDILVHAETEPSLRKRLNAIHSRLRDKGLTVNIEKTTEATKTVTFLGFQISAEGIKPCESLTARIRSVQPPTSVKEVETFVGLANFFGRLIPNFSSKVKGLNDLRKKGQKKI